MIQSKGVTMTYDEVCELFDCKLPTEPGCEVILSNDEINRARRNKRKMRQKAAGFHNSPVYRTLHGTMRLVIQIIQLMPKKTVKLSDMLLQNIAELIRWTAAAYNHKDMFLKMNALEEAISLGSVLRITINCMSNLVSDAKHKQLIASLDAVMRQLVAWRGSLEQSEGPDDATV